MGFEGFKSEDFALGGQGIGPAGVVGAGEGKNLDGAVRAGPADGGDQGPHGVTCGEDVVDEEEGSGGAGEGVAWGELINAFELGPAFAAGQVFVGEGRTGFGEEGREVVAAEVLRQGMAEKVKRGGKIGSGGCFVVAKGTNNNGVGGKGKLAEQSGGAIDPGVEVWLDALFEIEQANGKRICSGCQWEIWTEVEVGDVSIPAFYFGCQQPHDLSPSY